MCNAVLLYLFFTLTSIPPSINNSAILSCPSSAAKMDYFSLFLIF